MEDKEVKVVSTTGKAYESIISLGRRQPPMSMDHYHDTITRNKETRPLNTLCNFKELLYYYGITYAFDEVLRQLKIFVPDSGILENRMIEGMNGVIRSLCHRNKFPVSELDNYVPTLALKNVINPVDFWIRSTPWDGVDRIADLQKAITYEPDTPDNHSLYDMYIRKHMIGAYRMLINDGSQYQKNVLVFCGEQDISKTAFIRSLLPQDFARYVSTGQTLDTKAKNSDMIMSLCDGWIVEMSEIENLTKGSQQAMLKGFIGRSYDRFRLPYGRIISDQPRKSSFIGTVNDDKYLVDDDNVRWWTIPVEAMNADHGIDMQQFWAQIAHLADTGEPHWLESNQKEAQRRNAKQFKKWSGYEELIIEKLGGPPLETKPNGEKTEVDYLRPIQVLERLGIYTSNTQDSRRVSESLINLGFEYKLIKDRRKKFKVGQLLSKMSRK